MQFTSSIPNGDPACPRKKVVLTCQATGTSLRWDYHNGNNTDTIISYNAGEECGMYNEFNVTNKPEIFSPGVYVSTLLASVFNVSNINSDRVFNCTTILEINSTVPVGLLPNKIICVSILGESTHTRAFPYTVFMIGKYNYNHR